MEISDIIKYVSETPGNTNPAVLASMINQLGGGGGNSGVHIVNFWFDTDDPNYDNDDPSTWKILVDTDYTTVYNWLNNGEICIAYTDDWWAAAPMYLDYYYNYNPAFYLLAGDNPFYGLYISGAIEPNEIISHVSYILTPVTFELNLTTSPYSGTFSPSWETITTVDPVIGRYNNDIAFPRSNGDGSLTFEFPAFDASNNFLYSIVVQIGSDPTKAAAGIVDSITRIYPTPTLSSSNAITLYNTSNTALYVSGFFNQDGVYLYGEPLRKNNGEVTIYLPTDAGSTYKANGAFTVWTSYPDTINSISVSVPSSAYFQYAPMNNQTYTCYAAIPSNFSQSAYFSFTDGGAIE